MTASTWPDRLEKPALARIRSAGGPERAISFEGLIESPEFAEPSLKVAGDVYRYNHREGNDDYGQPRALFNIILYIPKLSDSSDISPTRTLFI